MTGKYVKIEINCERKGSWSDPCSKFSGVLAINGESVEGVVEEPCQLGSDKMRYIYGSLHGKTLVFYELVASNVMPAILYIFEDMAKNGTWYWAQEDDHYEGGGVRISTVPAESLDTRLLDDVRRRVLAISWNETLCDDVATGRIGCPVQ